MKKTINDYLDKLDWEVRENSNMAYSLQGLNHHLAGKAIKSYWLDEFYGSHLGDLHKSGDLHIHDLGYLSVYCVGWDLQDLLSEGFRGAVGKNSSSPAKHFRTALLQICNFFFTLAGEAAGAQAFSNFDTLLAPYIFFDALPYSQVKQAVQEFVFNLNVPTRVGFQAPFTNLSFDLVVPSHLKDTPVMIAGKYKYFDFEDRNWVYGDFQEEMDMLNKAFFEVMSEGDADGRVFTFPIPTYSITKDFDWDNPNLDGLWEMTAKYGIPYFSNFVNSDMSPEDVRSMCCRLRIDNTELRKRGGGLFGANPLTGSVGVVTLNLPRIAATSHKETDFFIGLEQLMQLAAETLEIKREALEALTEKGLYPYSKFYLRNVKLRFDKYWANHFSTIGIVGMHEAVLNAKWLKHAEEGITSYEGKAFALRVMNFMRRKLVEFQEETGSVWNLEATPAEGTSHRLALLDDTYGYHVTGKGRVEYYTNSTQLPVDYTDSIFKALEHQDELQCKYTGGTVIHFFLGEQVEYPANIRDMVKKICTNYKLPYFTFSPTFSICKHHGYIPGEHYVCPQCGEGTEVYSRVVGYLRPVQQWNDGKQQEFRDRKVFAPPEL